LPERRIPVWFDHQVYGYDASITFWFRQKIPAISLCLVVRPCSYEEIIQPRFIINGSRKTDVLVLNFENGGRVHNRVADHIIIFDIKQIPLDSTDVVFENKWNCVECTLFSLKNKLFIDKIGISVFKQGINMEDARFTNPELPKDKIGINVFKQGIMDKLFYFLCMLSWNWHRKNDRYFCYLGEFGHKILDISFCFIFLHIVC
jgi:hypothetical protein